MIVVLLRIGTQWPSAGSVACGRTISSMLGSVSARAFLQQRNLHDNGGKSPWLMQLVKEQVLYSYSSSHSPRELSAQRFSTSLKVCKHGRARLQASKALEAPSVKVFGEAFRHWRFLGQIRHQVRVFVDDAGKRKPPGSGPTIGGKELHPTPKYEPPSSQSSKPSSNSHSYFRDHLPSIPHLHRPSKEELLAAAGGFFSRMKVRFKWASIRSARPFNSDEIGGFISLIAFGHVVWLFIGTTTFISLAIWAINTLVAQETLARWIGTYLTKSSGLQVVFESAVVPKWGDGVISFHNVFVSRRPGSGTGNVSKGSPKTAAAARAAAAQAGRENVRLQDVPEEDQNYTQFDVSIDTINVTLSFTKWWNSKGLLKDVEVKGVRGVVDRTHVHTVEGIDPRSYRHKHHAGDFEIEDFKLEDLLVTLHQPGGFRPFPVSIYTCDLPRLRKQWLFYDFLSGNHCSGAYDDAQFNIHPRQLHGHVGHVIADDGTSAGENPWWKHNRLRIDGLDIHHLNRGVEGAFGWIERGTVDIVSDIMFPPDPDESISKVVSTMYGKLESTISDKLHLRIGDDVDAIYHDGTPPATHVRSPTSTTAVSEGASDADQRCIVMDLRVRINDIRAAVPAFPKDLSYVNNAMIRPIVAFLNSRPSWVPFNAQLVKRVSDFDGSWTLFDSGLMDEVSLELYNACTRDLQDSEARARRFRKVGIWSLQLVAQALFIGLVGNIS